MSREANSGTATWLTCGAKDSDRDLVYNKEEATKAACDACPNLDSKLQARRIASTSTF